MGRPMRRHIGSPMGIKMSPMGNSMGPVIAHGKPQGPCLSLRMGGYKSHETPHE